eukprot:TRINITY_DN8725_c0_g1_i21.p1 TRINITY_DN8725_c0_g1~~TRINITY_DN8725_c0_g1_i21.p1  ORF type:complete len:116 (-),score=31.86 TRINITY_DN8725_c0_g1_i21:280-627(-)
MKSEIIQAENELNACKEVNEKLKQEEEIDRQKRIHYEEELGKLEEQIAQEQLDQEKTKIADSELSPYHHKQDNKIYGFSAPSTKTLKWYMRTQSPRQSVANHQSNWWETSSEDSH